MSVVGARGLVWACRIYLVDDGGAFAFGLVWVVYLFLAQEVILGYLPHPSRAFYINPRTCPVNGHKGNYPL